MKSLYSKLYHDVDIETGAGLWLYITDFHLINPDPQWNHQEPLIPITRLILYWRD